MRRFAIKCERWVRPLLILGGGTADRSFIDVGAERVGLRYGWTHLAIPRDAIESVAEATLPPFAGIGWRWNFRHVLGLTGAMSPIAHFRLSRMIPTRLLGFPMRVNDLYVSVEEPVGLLDALATSAARE